MYMHHPRRQKKRQRVDEEDDEDAAEDAVSHMMQMTLYMASKNVEPPAKGKNKRIPPSNFKAPRAEVFSVMREEDESAHSLSGFVVTYGREMFVLPVDWLKSMNAYKDFAYGTKDVYSAFPLGKIAVMMSDDHDRDLNESPDGSDEDAEFGAEEIDAVRRAFITMRRDDDDDDVGGGGAGMCDGEGFIEFNKLGVNDQ
ncbi:hypothetical protein CAPTEDRAFT_199195 [Capitella teleta]|uniref:Uncharacterized protein n=1 Tax=Capitella teleta TaxID=283909 RepID=R7UGE0_CAPTE|nr:hypothetical protein CAPTEDRAFT_199195 [Capitella teleta]|eukprot:ELU05290.1 hypothetical protein CAPTEDRAFT_199195 [Capitella teleta]